MVHVFGAKASEALTCDERVCSPGDPWDPDDDRAFVVFHLSFVKVRSSVWTCMTCGTSSGAWERA